MPIQLVENGTRLVDWMTGLSAGWLSSWLVDNGTWLVDWMTGLSAGWLASWLVDNGTWLVDWMTGLAARLWLVGELIMPRGLRTG